MYLLDTNVVSEIRKIASGRADRNVTAWARRVNASQTYLSAITVSELEYGVILTERRDPDAGAILRAWLDNDVLEEFKHQILPVDTAVALYAAVSARARSHPCGRCLDRGDRSGPQHDARHPQHQRLPTLRRTHDHQPLETAIADCPQASDAITGSSQIKPPPLTNQSHTLQHRPGAPRGFGDHAFACHLLCGDLGINTATGLERTLIAYLRLRPIWWSWRQPCTLLATSQRERLQERLNHGTDRRSKTTKPTVGICRDKT